MLTEDLAPSKIALWGSFLPSFLRVSFVAKLKFDPAKMLGFVDPRTVPTYSIAEAAHYLRMPEITLRTWVLGRDYKTKYEKREFAPIIEIADPASHLMSFVNLAEAHVLSACRRTFKVPLENIRHALHFVVKEFGADHPLVDHEFATDGASLFVEKLGKLVDASARGQEVMRSVIEQYLQRLDRENKLVTRLWPFTRDNLDSPKSVFIDPRVSFGRAVLAAAGVPTSSLAERWLAGEPAEHLAKDYDCKTLDIEEAIRCEVRLDAAA
jgi:uncharacterized protein (DUF433 family)